MPEVERHSRWEQYPRKADLIRDLRTFFNHLEDSVDPAQDANALLAIEYDTLPNATLKSVAGLGLYTFDSTSVAVPDGLNVLDTGLPTGRWVKVTTGGGPASSYTLTSHAFSFASVPLAIMLPLPMGTRVDGVTVEVSTAFDGVGASLLVGTPTLPSLYFGVGASKLSVGGAFYHNDKVYTAPLSEALILTLATAGSTAGTGAVHVRTQGP